MSCLKSIVTSIDKVSILIVNFTVSCLFLACSEKKNMVTSQKPTESVNQKIMSFEDLPGQQIWFGDPNKPWREVFTNFNNEDNGGTIPTLTSVNDPQLGKVWQVYKPAGAKRAEISRAKGYVQKEGEIIYISYKWKIAIKQEDVKKGFAVFQWKTDNGNTLQNYPFTLGYNGDGTLSLDTHGPGDESGWWSKPGSSISKRENTVWTKQIPQNQWQSIIFGVKVSSYIGTDTTKLGYLEYWFNGVKQKFSVEKPAPDYKLILSDDKTRAYLRTLDGNITYPKWGAYGEAGRSFDVTAFVGDLRIKRK